MMWSGDGSLANRMSLVLFMFTNFDYEMSRFILRGKLGVDNFKCGLHDKIYATQHVRAMHILSTLYFHFLAQVH
jgi:hypothetical protein